MTEQEAINRLGQPDRFESPARGMTESQIIHRYIESDFGRTWQPGEPFPSQALNWFENGNPEEARGAWKATFYSPIDRFSHTGFPSRPTIIGMDGCRVSLLFL